MHLTCQSATGVVIKRSREAQSPARAQLKRGLKRAQGGKAKHSCCLQGVRQYLSARELRKTHSPKKSPARSGLGGGASASWMRLGVGAINYTRPSAQRDKLLLVPCARTRKKARRKWGLTRG
jgi:hypothetical protein